MNEQQLADLFSEELDRMFQGEPASVPSEANEVQELLNMVGLPAVQHQFQAGAALQAAFQSQLVTWFGLASKGIPMTILGLSKIWFISIIVATVVVISGAGLIAVTITSFLIYGPISAILASPTAEPAVSVTTSPEASTTPAVTPDPTDSPTSDTSETPATSPALPPLLFIGNIQVPTLCQGAYSTHSTLVNYGGLPVNDAALVWEVIEGSDWVDNVVIGSPDLAGNVAAAENTAESDDSDPLLVVLSTDPPILGNFSNFSPIRVEQNIKLDVDVKVNDKWWTAKKGSKIKVKLSVKQKFGDAGEFKLKYKADYKSKGPGRVITIVKQDSRWINLSGVAQPVGQNYIVDGVTVVTDHCTGLPVVFQPGSFVNVIGWVQPNLTFYAVNISVVNINIFNGNFDSGVPSEGGSGGGKGGSGGGKGGGGKGGSGGGKGGSGGSRGGSGGS